MAQPGKLENEGGWNGSGPLALAGGAVMDRGAFFAVEKSSGAAISVNNAVVSDEGVAIDGVKTLAGADSTARFGIAQSPSVAAGSTNVWVAVLGKVTALSVAAGVAAGDICANGAVAGQCKTAAAAGGRTNLGRALAASGAVANNPFPLEVDKA
jgi:hypothetical protein